MLPTNSEATKRHEPKMIEAKQRKRKGKKKREKENEMK